MNTRKWVNTHNVENNEPEIFPAKENSVEKSICGRSYNEESDFSATNYFAALQNILDKRNELLSSVKANQRP